LPTFRPRVQFPSPAPLLARSIYFRRDVSPVHFKEV